MHREPVYLQIKNQIMAMIRAGRLHYGQSLPPERELAEAFGVNRKTLRKATQQLENEGILQRIQGKGTYLNRQPLYDPNKISGFGDTVRALGMRHTIRLLYTNTAPAGDRLGRLLETDPDEPVYRMVRLRLGDGKPMALQSTYVLHRLIPNVEKIDFGMFSLYDVFAQHGIAVKRVQETITPLLLRNPEAKLLDTPEDSPGFSVEDISYDEAGHPMEYTKTYMYNQIIAVDSPREK